MPLPADLAALPAWGFAFPGPLRDELTALALTGTKTTTAGLFAEMEVDGEALPIPGTREILLDSDERPVALIETVDCRVVRLADRFDPRAVRERPGGSICLRNRRHRAIRWRLRQPGGPAG